MTDMCELQLERGALVLRGFDDSPMSSAMSSARFYKLDRSALAERLPSSFAELDSLLGVKTAAEHFTAAFRLPCLAGADDRRLFAKVCEWALEALQDPALQELPPLAPGESRTFTARQCCGILANAMLGNVADLMAEHKHNLGGLSFVRHLRFAEGVYKTAALLVYFEARMQADGTEDDGREVVFEHLRCPSESEFEELVRRRGDVRLAADASTCTLHADVMEAPPADAFVNFANSNFGYGCFIPSCTQEEILQMCCPEFNVGMLLIGAMGDGEAVNVRGCRRYSRYTGYLDSYECAGAWPSHTICTILTLDACTHAHFSRRHLLRDVRKAYTSFAMLAEAKRADGDATSTAVVSTGRWGCGVFGGVPAHKFLQQLIAASLAGVRLAFSTFGQPDGCDELLEKIGSTQLSVGQAWELLGACRIVRFRGGWRRYARRVCLRPIPRGHGEGIVRSLLPPQVEPWARVVQASRVVASHVCPVAREVDGAEVVRHERTARAVELVADPRAPVIELRVPYQDVALLRVELRGMQFMFF